MNVRHKFRDEAGLREFIKNHPIPKEHMVVLGRDIYRPDGARLQTPVDELSHVIGVFPPHVYRQLPNDEAATVIVKTAYLTNSADGESFSLDKDMKVISRRRRGLFVVALG